MPQTNMEFNSVLDHLSLDDLGFQKGDIALEVVQLESGAVELSARLSPHGVAIIERVAALYDLTPDDLFGRIVRHALIVRAGRL